MLELIQGEVSTSMASPLGGVLPYKGLMGTCGQPGYVFQDFCLKQGQGMRDRATPPHPRIYRVPPPGHLHTNLYKFGQKLIRGCSTPYEFLVWVKHFFGYLVYEIFLWPESWRRSLYMYLLSFPRFWTLSIERFDFYFDLFWMAWHWKPAIWYEASLDGTLTCMNKAIPLAWGPVP